MKRNCTSPYLTLGMIHKKIYLNFRFTVHGVEVLKKSYNDMSHNKNLNFERN